MKMTNKERKEMIDTYNKMWFKYEEGIISREEWIEYAKGVLDRFLYENEEMLVRLKNV